MSKSIHLTSLPEADEIESIPATEMKNAHGKRLPAILRKKGIARVTRYKETDYFVLSREMFLMLRNQAKRPQNSKILDLKEQYRKLVTDMQSLEHQSAFAALSSASDADIGKSTLVGASD